MNQSYESTIFDEEDELQMSGLDPRKTYNCCRDNFFKSFRS
jgi:hypothetical protein